MEAKRLFGARNLAAAILAAAILWICLFSGLSAVGLAGPDEPRYAWIARNMAETGNWVTPILYGKPWFEKPILYYWAAAIGFKFIHSPEWAARLPASLAALAATLAMAWLAWRRYGASTAWAVLVILPACFGMIGFSRAAAPDMLFAGSLAVAFACAATVVEQNTPSSSADEVSARQDFVPLLLLGASLGVATLAKGPAAILLAGGSTILWALITRHWRAAIRMLHPVAILAFVIVASPWYVLCGLRNPEFFRVFILQHNFGRYLTPEFHHRQPIWFFIPIILIGLLPWTALLGGAALDARRIWREKTYANSLGLFAACWAAFPVVFFSFSQSKLPGYVLPAIPPLALLLARSFVRATESAPRVSAWLGILTGIVWIAVAYVASRSMHRMPAAAFTPTEGHQLAMDVLVTAVVAGIAVILMCAWRKFFAALAISAMLAAAMVVFANRSFLPKVDPYISARALAKIVPRPLPTLPQEVPLIGVNRSCEYGVRFYRPEINFVRWNLQQTQAVPFNGYALVGPDGEIYLSHLQSEERHFVRGYSPGCWIEFLHASLSGR